MIEMGLFVSASMVGTERASCFESSVEGKEGGLLVEFILGAVVTRLTLNRPPPHTPTTQRPGQVASPSPGPFSGWAKDRAPSVCVH